jgi:hypothetical protein
MSTVSSNESICRAASRLRLAIFAAMALMILVYVAARFDLRLGQLRFEDRHGAGTPYGSLIAAGSMVLLLIALFRLTQMLNRIAAGELFSAAVIRHFRGFALWLLLMALFELIAPLAAGVLGATHSYPHHVRLALDLRDLLTVGTTLLLFLLASLLERARRLDEEMREFV